MNDLKKWTVEKLTFGKDPLEVHETSSLSIIGMIMTKRSSAAFVRTIFCLTCRVHALLSFFMRCGPSDRTCFHAYVVSVNGAHMLMPW